MKKIFLLVTLLIITPTGYSQTAKEYFSLGKKRWPQDTKAIDYYSKAIEKNPKYTKAYLDRGDARFGIHDYAGAIEDYSKVIEIKPRFEDGLALFSRGVAKEKLQDYKGAIDDYTNAIIVCKRIPAYFISRGDAKAEMNDYEEAIEDYTKAIKLYTDSFGLGYIYLVRGVAKEKLQDYEGAAKDYTDAIFFDSRLYQAYFNRGTISVLFLDQKAQGCSDLWQAKELGFEKAYEAIEKYCK